jgi:hypothetical protein
MCSARLRKWAQELTNSRWIKRERNHAFKVLYRNEQINRIKMQYIGSMHAWNQVMYPAVSPLPPAPLQRVGEYEFSSNENSDLLRNGKVVFSMRSIVNGIVRLSTARISPDGERVAVVAEIDGVLFGAGYCQWRTVGDR